MRNPFARRAPVARIDPPPVAERSGGGAGWVSGGFGFGNSSASLAMTDSPTSYVAENASAVVACINAICSGLGSLPIRTYRRVPGGARIELDDSEHWLPRLLRYPGPNVTTYELWEHLLSSALLHGNGIALIGYDDDGTPNSLYPVPWLSCTPILIPSQKLAFDISMTFGPFAGPGIFRRYLSQDCLYLKDRSDNGGWTGRSRLSRSPQVIAAALALSEYSTAMFRNGASLSGVITHPGKLNDVAKTYLNQQFSEKHSGPVNAKKVLLLDEAMKFDASGNVSPIDAETVAQKMFMVPEICRIMGVPPSVVYSTENNAFTSSEQQNRMFAQLSLAPWARKLEQVIEKALLGDEPDIFVEFDFSALTRGVFSERWAAWATALQNKVLTVAEVREVEGYGPMPEPGEMLPPDEAGA